MDFQSFANYIKDNYESKDKSCSCDCFHYCFPIKEIDGLPCAVKLELKFMGREFYYLYFQIEERFIFCRDIDDNNTTHRYFFKSFKVSEKNKPMDIERIAISLKIIFDIIPQLKFNKFEGNLQTDTKDKDILPFIKQFCHHENVKTSFEDCCVCYETTKTKTMCGHSLCMLCWEKMPFTRGENDEDPMQRCPICRDVLVLIC